MSELVEVKTRELSGPALDWAVAKTEGLPSLIYPCEPPYIYIDLPGRGCGPYHPSYNWADGGPLLAKHRVGFGLYPNAYFACTGTNDDAGEASGPTHLIAACRAIAASSLGDTVSVPKVLVV